MTIFLQRLSKVMGLLCAFTCMQIQAQENDFNGVTEAVKKYFDGTSKGTPELLAEVFLPDLKLQHIRDGKRVTWQGSDYIAGFKAGEKYNRVGRIISVDITRNTAMVKAEIEMNDNIYVDYLLLLNVDGKWRISDKIFSVR